MGRYIEGLVEYYFRQIMEFYHKDVLCQGEFCLSYQVITRLRRDGIPVLAACSERKVWEAGQKKEVVFLFRQFRKYGEGD